MENVPTEQPPKQKWYSRLVGSTTSYLLEYYVMIGFLSYTVGIVIYVTTLVNRSIVGEINPSSLDALLVNTAFLIVIAPLTLLLMRRTENEELRRPMRLKQELRKVVGYLASIVALLYSVGVTIYAVTGILFTVYGRDSVNIDYLPTLIIAAMLLVAMAKYVGSQRAISEDSVRNAISRSTPAILGMIFLILLVVPLFITRSPSFNDNQTIKDLYEIGNAIERYAKNNDELPDRINDLDLSDDLLDRAAEMDYTYIDRGIRSATSTDRYNYANFELCADFGGSGTLDNTTGYYYDSYSSNKPIKRGTKYTKGENCFRYDDIRLSYDSSPRLSEPLNPIFNERDQDLPPDPEPRLAPTPGTSLN